MRLILVRHGQTRSNVEHVIDTRIPGRGLTDLGRRQAESLPDALKADRIDAIFASTLLRSQQTAAPLAEARRREVLVREGLREIGAGVLEGKSDRPSVEDFVSTEMAWVRGDLERRMPGAETGRETLARFDEVVTEAYNADHSSVVFVSHGSVIRTWAGIRADNIDADFVHANPLHNTGVVVLEGSPHGRWTVLTWLERAIGGAGLDDEGAAGPVADETDG
jgi:broad specificity phosphatase PhoE